jgi:hypothetical protein
MLLPGMKEGSFRLPVSKLNEYKNRLRELMDGEPASGSSGGDGQDAEKGDQSGFISYANAVNRARGGMNYVDAAQAGLGDEVIRGMLQPGCRKDSYKLPESMLPEFRQRFAELRGGLSADAAPTSDEATIGLSTIYGRTGLGRLSPDLVTRKVLEDRRLRPYVTGDEKTGYAVPLSLRTSVTGLIATLRGSVE